VKDSDFFDQYHFRIIEFQRYHYTDNRAGVPVHYFGCLKSGWAKLTDGTTEITVHPGELFYIPKGCRYQSYWHAEGTIRFLSIAFTAFPNPSHRTYRLQKIDCTPEEQEIVQRFMDQPPAFGALGIGRLFVLIGMAESHMSVELIDRRSDIVERAMLYMNRRNRINAEELAAHCGISVSTLYQAFRKSLKKTPGEVWHEVQIQKATEMLLTTDLRIEEISDRLEFSSSSYFRKIFKAQTGKTPREVRKSSPFFTVGKAK